MNTKQILILFLFCSIFLVAMLMRPNLTGGDTYYFVNYIWGITDTLPEETQLSVMIMDIIPANFILIKIIMFWLTFLSCLAISLTGELFEKDYGWLAGLILLCTIFFTTIFINFENDIFAFLFIAWSLFFVSKYRMTGETLWSWLSFFCIGIAGLIWTYSAFFIIPLMIISKFNWKFVFLLSGLIALYPLKFISNILPNLYFQETMPLYAMFSIVFFIICYIKDYRIKELYPAILVATLFALLNLKQTYVLVPLLAISMGATIKKLSKPLVIFTILSFVVVLGILLCNIITAYPNNDTNELFSIANSLKETQFTDKEINILWDYGYYWAFYNKEPLVIYEHRAETPKTGIVITRTFDSSLNDVCTKWFENKSGKIYVC